MRDRVRQIGNETKVKKMKNKTKHTKIVTQNVRNSLNEMSTEVENVSVKLFMCSGNSNTAL